MGDTSCGFCPIRCAQLLKRNVFNSEAQQTPGAGQALSSKYDSEAYSMDPRMKKLSVFTVFDTYELYSTLENIAQMLCFKPSAAAPVPIVLVIDCMATFIAPNLCKGYSAQASIESLGKMLRQIAREFRMAVIVTNNAVSDRSTKSGGWKPA